MLRRRQLAVVAVFTLEPSLAQCPPQAQPRGALQELADEVPGVVVADIIRKQQSEQFLLQCLRAIEQRLRLRRRGVTARGVQLLDEPARHERLKSAITAAMSAALISSENSRVMSSCCTAFARFSAIRSLVGGAGAGASTDETSVPSANASSSRNASGSANTAHPGPVRGSRCSFVTSRTAIACSDNSSDAASQACEVSRPSNRTQHQAGIADARDDAARDVLVFQVTAHVRDV